MLLERWNEHQNLHYQSVQQSHWHVFIRLSHWSYLSLETFIIKSDVKTYTDTITWLRVVWHTETTVWCHSRPGTLTHFSLVFFVCFFNLFFEISHNYLHMQVIKTRSNRLQETVALKIVRFGIFWCCQLTVSSSFPSLLRCSTMLNGGEHVTRCLSSSLWSSWWQGCWFFLDGSFFSALN